MLKSKKITLSPGQGLLKLIDYYKEDQARLEELKKLYLCGATTQKEAKRIKVLLKDKRLASYQICDDMQTINNDPTRRYFETHLAYESLKNGLSKISKQDLETHAEALKAMLPTLKWLRVEPILSGEYQKHDDNLSKEYADYIAKINAGTIFAELALEDREKIELLVKCSFLGVMNAQCNRLPLNIYGVGIYAEKNKGKRLLPNQQSTRNQHLGIIKGHMPLARNDIAYSEQEIPYLKPSDQASFIKEAAWVKQNFSKWVHPFSNSISGTMLSQLRSHAKLRNEGQSVFTDSAQKLEQYSQLLISAMLFNSGGHSLYEFVAPLSLKEVKREFGSIKDFNKITLESMYLNHNKEGFDKALQRTLDYNKAILTRENLHAQVKGIHPVESNNNALAKLKTLQELKCLSELVANKKQSYELRIKNQWFSSYRMGVQKNVLIQNGLAELINHLDNADLAKSQQTIRALKQSLELKFGKLNVGWRKSASFKLLESIEGELTRIQTNLGSLKTTPRVTPGDIVEIKTQRKIQPRLN